MGHVSELEIERYLDDDLSFLGKKMFESHLEGCVECRRLLEKARADRQYLNAMGAGLAKLRQADDDIEKSSIGRTFYGE